MPLGIVSDADFEKELNKIPNVNVGDTFPRDLIPSISPLKTPGRYENIPNVPDSLRAIVAEEHISGADRTELARTFGISKQSVDAYKNGATSLATYNKPDKKLARHIDIFKERVTKRASRKLIGALDSIPNDLSDEKPQVASQIAKDMSVIIKNMTPDIPVQPNSGVNFVIFAPKQRDEKDFDVVEVFD